MAFSPILATRPFMMPLNDHNRVAAPIVDVYAVCMRPTCGGCLIWLALFAGALGLPAQVVYDTGVTAVTVAGQPGVASDHDETGDEVLLGDTHGIAALGDVGFNRADVCSRHSGGVTGFRQARAAGP